MRSWLLPWMTLIVLTCAGSRAQAVDTIIWHYFDFPPLYVVSSNGDEPYGAGIELHDRLIDELNDFDHERRRFSLARAFALARADVLVCFVGPHRTPERETFLVYSQPFFVYSPPMLTLRRDMLSGNDEQRPRSLAQVLQRHGNRFGLPVGLSYGPETDAILERYGGSALRLFGEGRSERALRLLSLGRIDYTIAQPLAFHWLADQRGFGDALIQIPLVDATQFEGFAVACTDTSAGRQAIAHIDSLLGDPQTADAFEAIMLRWIDPALHPVFTEALAHLPVTTQ